MRLGRRARRVAGANAGPAGSGGGSSPCESMIIEDDGKAAALTKRGGGGKHAVAGKGGRVEDDLVGKVLLKVSAHERAFVGDVRDLTSVQTREKRRIHAEYSDMADSTLEQFIQHQARLVEKDKQAELDRARAAADTRVQVSGGALGQLGCSDDCDAGDQPQGPTQPDLNAPARIKTRLKVHLGDDDAGSVSSYNTENELRLEDRKLYVEEKRHVRKGLTNALGASPRGMTLEEAVLSPKRNNQLQSMLAKPAWTDVHETAYQHYRKNRHRVKSQHTPMSSSAHSLMSNFLCMHEFRAAHVEAVRLSRKTHKRRRGAVSTGGPKYGGSNNHGDHDEAGSEAGSPSSQGREKGGGVFWRQRQDPPGQSQRSPPRPETAAMTTLAGQRRRGKGATSHNGRRGGASPHGGGSGWAAYQEMLDGHNAHAHAGSSSNSSNSGTGPVAGPGVQPLGGSSSNNGAPAVIASSPTNNGLDSFFTPAEEMVARRELAAFIVKSRDTYIQGFMLKRQAYLLTRIQRRKASVLKRRRRQEQATSMASSRQRLRSEVEKTRRRLSEIELRPSTPAPAAKAQSGMRACASTSAGAPCRATNGGAQGSAVLFAGVLCTKTSSGRAEDIAEAGKTTPKGDKGAKQMDVQRMKKVFKRYAATVHEKGGGAIKRPAGEGARRRCAAATMMQALFRGQLARKYLDALRFVEHPFHLGTAIKRLETRPGLVDFRMVPQLLEELGRAKPELSELEPMLARLGSQLVEEKQGDGVRQAQVVTKLLPSAFVKQEFLQERHRNPTPYEMLRVVRSASALKFREDMLLKRKRSVQPGSARMLARKLRDTMAASSATALQAGASAASTSEDRGPRKSCAPRAGRSSASPTNAKTGARPKTEAKARTKTKTKTEDKTSDPAGNPGRPTQEAQRHAQGSGRAMPLSPQDNTFVKTVAFSLDEDKRSRQKSSDRSSPRTGARRSKAVHKSPDGRSSGAHTKARPSSSGARPTSAPRSRPRAALSSSQSAGALQTKRKTTTKHIKAREHCCKPDAGAPQADVKRYKERIDANRRLAERLRASRVELKHAARQLWEEKNNVGRSVADAIHCTEVTSAPRTQQARRSRPASAPAARREKAGGLSSFCAALDHAYQEYDYSKYKIKAEAQKAAAGEGATAAAAGSLSFEDYLYMREKRLANPAQTAEDEGRAVSCSRQPWQVPEEGRRAEITARTMSATPGGRSMPGACGFGAADPVISAQLEQNEANKAFLARESLSRMRANPLLASKTST